MQSKAATVAEYLASLPEDRRVAISAVRKVILANLDSAFEEGMQYGMIGYHVPHRLYPAGYHCDPKQPLPYAGLASQKQYMSLYLPLHLGPGAGALMMWFQDAWAKAGKKLDMGKCCLRFKRLDDLALDVVAQTFRRLPAKAFIASYEASLAARPAPMPRATIKEMVARREAANQTARKVTKKSMKKAASTTTGKAMKKKMGKNEAARR